MIRPSTNTCRRLRINDPVKVQAGGRKSEGIISFCGHGYQMCMDGSIPVVLMEGAWHGSKYHFNTEYVYLQGGSNE